MLKNTFSEALAPSASMGIPDDLEVVMILEVNQKGDHIAIPIKFLTCVVPKSMLHNQSFVLLLCYFLV